MSQVFESSYLGLPIPNEVEHSRLKTFLYDSDDNAYFSVEGLFEIVESRRTLIADAIDDDLEEFARTDVVRNMKPSEKEQAFAGLEAGYEFMIGVITYIHFMRSGHRNMADFLLNLPRRSPALPLRKFSQADRFVECLQGNAALDIDDHRPGKKRQTSKELAVLDFTAYTFRADSIAAAVATEVDDIANDDEFIISDEERGAYITGFWRGAANAVEMYIQSYEEDEINQARPQLQVLVADEEID